jgi:hypothetical protein
MENFTRFSEHKAGLILPPLPTAFSLKTYPLNLLVAADRSCILGWLKMSPEETARVEIDAMLFASGRLAQF